MTLRQIGLSLGIFLVLGLFLALQVEKRSHARTKAQAVRLSMELERISTAKNEQKVITRERIVEVERVRKDADKVAKRVEAAPLPGQCKTPEAIMGADL